MADDHRKAHHPIDQVGEASTDIQLALDKRLADLKQLLETVPSLSSTEAAHMETYEGYRSLPANRSQFPFQVAFPNHPVPNTFASPPRLNNLIDNIWDLRRRQERGFDPLLYLGDDVMHSVLLYAVSLWDIAESRVWGAETIPKNHWGDPLVLMNVSRRWSQFITSSPPLWSYVLLDTDDDNVREYLELSFLLSRNRRLFIVLHGSGNVCLDILVDLLQVGDRIDTLVYPPNVSHYILTMFRMYLDTSHEPEDIWHKLEVQSSVQSRRYLHYTFPITIQSLWMGGLFPLSRLMTLSHFQSLSFLSARISLNKALPPAHNYRLELPKLEVLRVQMILGSRDQVGAPINMICRNLKLLDLRYTLELDLKNAHEQPAIWMEFGEVDGVEELQIDIAIHEVTAPIQSSTERLRGLGWMEQPEQQRWEQQLQWMEQRLEERRLVHQERLLQRELQRLQLQWLEEQRHEEQLVQRLEEQRYEQRLAQRLAQWRRQRREKREQEVQYLLFMKSICTHWREWLNLPNSLTHVRRSSLKVTHSTRMHQGTCRVMRNLVEDILVLSLPQLTELTTSDVLLIFPEHLRKLRFHGFGVSDSWPPITLPSLVSLEIIADSPDHLQVMTCIQVPQLRVLRVQIEDGPGTLHQHAWGHTMNNQLDQISLRIEIPRDKQDNDILVFHFPQTQSLHISSPHIPLHLHLATPTPSLYTLDAGLGTMSGLPDGQVGTL